MRAWHRAFIITLAAIGLLMGTAIRDAAQSEARIPAPMGDPTPGCATHHEYDKIQNIMRPYRVAEIVGNDGWYIDTADPAHFARGYRSCWAPGVRFVKVWFDEPSDLSYDKAILDVN